MRGALMDFQGFPHQVAGDAPVTTLDVIVYSFVMVAMSGLGGLPFFLLPGGLSKRSAGLANALAAGVSVATLNAFADDARHDDEETNWLDDTVSLLEASVRERATPALTKTGVPATAIRCDVAAAPNTSASIGDTICAVAHDVDARLVVMAKRGCRGALSEALLGSATNRVARKSKAPVLVWNVAPERTKKQAASDAEDALDDPSDDV